MYQKIRSKVIEEIKRNNNNKRDNNSVFQNLSKLNQKQIITEQYPSHQTKNNKTQKKN
jgi:hypothetical protein